MKSVLISVAHSSVSPGSQNALDDSLSEYLVSLRASIAAFRSLSGSCAVELFDCGPLKQRDYDDAKILRVNQCKPDLAVELHLNAGGGRYSEAIYHSKSEDGAAAAKAIAASMHDNLKPFLGTEIVTRGGRANSVADDKALFFFLRETHVPAVIVEGLFIDRPAHAQWIAKYHAQRPGYAGHGAELYGMYVADGIKRWLGVPL